MTLRLILVLAAWIALSPAALPAGTADRDYTLSLEVVYGLQKSRRSYLEEIDHHLRTWMAASGPLHGSMRRGETDLHLRVLIDDIEREGSARSVDAEMDPRRSTMAGADTSRHSTKFEVRVELVDPWREDAVVFDARFTVYNQETGGQHIPDPKGRSWRTNLDFLVTKVRKFLAKKERPVARYLEAHPRPAAAVPEPR